MRGKHRGPKDPPVHTSHTAKYDTKRVCHVEWGNSFAGRRRGGGETRSPGGRGGGGRKGTCLARNGEGRNVEGETERREGLRAAARGWKRSKSGCHEQVCGRSGIGAGLTFA